MTEHDRVIGELLEFKRVALEQLAEIRADQRASNEFRWRSTTLVSAMVSLGTSSLGLWIIKNFFGGEK